MTSETRLGFVAAYNRAVSHVMGLRDVWIGNGLNCVKIALEMGIKLFAFDTIKAHVKELQTLYNLSAGERIIACGCAGALAEFSIYVYPLDVIKTQLAMGSYHGLQDCTQSAWNSGGI